MGLILNSDFTLDANFPVDPLLSIETEVERRARHQRNQDDYDRDMKRRRRCANELCGFYLVYEGGLCFECFQDRNEDAGR